MGYTHYWYRSVDNPGTADQYAELRMDASRLISRAILSQAIVRGPFGTGQPVFTEDYFSFNGDSDFGLDHETFRWKRIAVLSQYEADAGQDQAFSFCKTAYKPYDAVVTAVLIRAKEIYGDLVSVASDGSWDEWAAGRLLYEWTFGVSPANPMTDNIAVS